MLDRLLLNIIIATLMEVESDCNPNAIGDDGKAVGILQIHPITVDDVNRIMDMDDEISHPVFTLADRYDVEKSKQMCAIYLTYYLSKYLAYKPFTTMSHKEICARLWNGGYQGLKNNPDATDAYWQKFENEIDRLVYNLKY